MRKSPNSIIAAIMFFITLVVVAGFVLSEQKQDTEYNRFTALQELSRIRAQLEGLINANLISMRSLRAEFSLNAEVDRERFDQLTAALLSDDLHVRHVAIAPNLIVSHIYPESGNEAAIGLDYRTSPGQYQSVQEAIAAREITINGPIELVQGGTALIARLPVFSQHDGSLWGIVSQVIDYEHLLDDAGVHQSDSLTISLRGANGSGEKGPIISGNPTVWEQNPLTTQVTLPQGYWVLAAQPISGRWAPPLYHYYGWWTLGLVVSLLLSILSFALLNTISKLRSAFATISHQAQYDSLTGLPNRSYFVQHLNDLVRQGNRKAKPFAILFIDLDHFKEINDSLGHEAGDILLQQVAKRIRNTVRLNDVVARFGGDEFVVLVTDLNEPFEAEVIANNIFRALQPILSIENHDVLMQASIGVSVFPNDGTSASDLLKHADLAMYAAKSSGRGTSYFFNESLREQAESHLQLHQEILKGLDREQFSVHYQPIIHSQSNSIVAIEALVRWHHPTLGLISPAHFIPVAEKTGTIREIGQFVLERVCQDYHRLINADLPLRISVNRSSREFNDPNAVNQWIDTLDRYKVPRSCITFEITESILMPDKERQHKMLEALASTGINLAIDDFGTGYSSVTYLRNFPVRQVKIDRAFLHQVPSNTQQVALVKAVIEMSHALQLDIVAEGVETEQQGTALRALHCTFQQGYYYARPLPLDQLIMQFNPHTGISSHRYQL
ncbi:putative bifunctional diguanylate cyclase/phosphodiesterase [Aliidiomarina celeris]|uniref:putative bifunctional diguanylate cyclase/phosphodiesterase n=1 Tax=Aliidiomarina celeris TaxID=2249428 RepID=UPI0013001DF4|nr:EAL domain-containing protein [Aliidiomarina celeris]